MFSARAARNQVGGYSGAGVGGAGEPHLGRGPGARELGRIIRRVREGGGGEQQQRGEGASHATLAISSRAYAVSGVA